MVSHVLKTSIQCKESYSLIDSLSRYFMVLMILRKPKTKEASMTWKYPLPLIAKKGTINAIGWEDYGKCLLGP